jgi:hypothetical protein
MRLLQKFSGFPFDAGTTANFSRRMRISLFYFIISSLSIPGVAFGQDKHPSDAIVMDALFNAKEINIKGNASVGYFEPLVNVDVIFKSLSGIGELRKCIESGGFNATEFLCPEDGKWASGSEAVLRCVISESTGRKVTFFLIEGDTMRISGCYDSKSRDPNYIFRLSEILLRYRSK